jgi:hypothetical protein
MKCRHGHGAAVLFPPLAVILQRNFPQKKLGQFNIFTEYSGHLEQTAKQRIFSEFSKKNE